MRIHRLEICAFGPFAGTETIDFDRLSAHGLFLLNGATGAGKTSVLDAICYALYGSVPGARQDGKRLRSDHAEAATEPSVTCEFTARGRRFEVSRFPAWDKPSARGRNGFTAQKAKTLLRERVGGEWIEKSGRNDEAGGEIAAILGMDREQFTRVVMLPQGDFAAFLRSKASDRMDLLQKLFGTERFEAVERELALKAAEAAKEVSGHNGRLALLVERARAEAEALGLELDNAPAAGKARELLVWLEDAASRRAAELGTAAESSEALRREHAARLEAELARESRQLKLAAAMRRKSAACAAAPVLEQNAARLALHRKAETLGGQLKAVAAAEAAVERSASAMARAAADLQAAARTDVELAHTDHADVDTAAELGRLRALLAVVNERAADEDRLTALAARSTDLTARRQDLLRTTENQAETLTALRTEMERLHAGLQPLAQLASEAVLRTKESMAADELVDVVRRYGAAAGKCAAATERHLKGRDAYQESRQRWLDIREQRLANAAAELAARLDAGEPCPVCGGTEHPDPVPAAASVRGLAEEEERAREACDAAELSLAALDAELAAARQEVAVLAGQGGDTDPADAAEAARVARAAAAEAEAAEVQLAEARARYEGLEDRVTATEQARTGCLSRIAQLESTLAELDQQSTALESALAALRAGYPSLRRRSAGIGETIAVLERAASAHTAWELASARLDEAHAQLELALPEAGFGTAAEAHEALLDPEDAARLEAAVLAGRDEQARLEELFASDELILAEEEHAAGITAEAGEIDRLRAEAERAAGQAKDLALAAGLAAQKCTALRGLREDYEELAESGRAPRDRAERLSALADSVRGGGDNSYRMSLNSYVLAARLEQVAVAASERLVAMSDGRYTLQHTDAKAARGAKSGLGLEVVDAWTGQRRDTSTLSGGESFMASLSLALGLADVVQHEAGGVDIETLFVDEGFGSLDEQALEQVMDALEGLRDGGRVVGLVSHVAEMKQRIGTQLQVVKGRNGSTLHISDAVMAA
ncbi:AAA family ATPase [Arthrobacter sp. NPDC093139]|uniref:AAA family ATPase n=1 Tax=Arthrobacter sp. NPDC093139 TaxID=3363945 RepID=UPI00381CE345